MQTSFTRRAVLGRGLLSAGACIAAPGLVRAQSPRTLNLGFSTPVESDYGVLATKLISHQLIGGVSARVAGTAPATTK